MGRQQSVVQLTGSIGNLTFYKTNDGFLARQRGNGISSARMNSDPRFKRTQENLTEFGRANKASKLVRTALREIVVKKSGQVHDPQTLQCLRRYFFDLLQISFSLK